MDERYHESVEQLYRLRIQNLWGQVRVEPSVHLHRISRENLLGYSPALSVLSRNRSAEDPLTDEVWALGKSLR